MKSSAIVKFKIITPTIFADINGKWFVESDFISSYNGRSGRTKMAIAVVKMQTGWIPVCIKRLTMNKYNKLYTFYLTELQFNLIILLLHTLVRV